MKKSIPISIILQIFLIGNLFAQQAISITIDAGTQYQTIAGFAASDCWTGNYVGKYWDETPKNTISKYLFSQNYKPDGSPEGIGLSMWRVNLGAGTMEQGNDSDIEDISRRSECFLDNTGNYDWTKQAGQQWFMQKAKEYGCEKFVLFSNSPLVAYTRNGKGYSNSDGNANLQVDKYGDFAGYLATVAEHFIQEGYNINYISPVNEPQWDWKEPSQEGSPWQNSEIKNLVTELNNAIQTKGIDTKILITEAGQWNYLYQNNTRAGNQIYEFFDKRSPDYIGDLPALAPVIGGHSYWTHNTNVQLRNTRLDVKTNAKKYNLSVFQTEWSMLNAGEGLTNIETASYMDIALFMAKIIHSDLAYADASSWSYWTAMDMERWGHKNRFLLVSLSPNNPYNNITQSATVADRATLWALGNYSFFIRPGYQRILLDGADDLNGLMATAYIAPDKSKIVAVYVNMSTEAKKVQTTFLNSGNYKPTTNKVYITSSSYNLKKYGNASSESYTEDREITVPARSVTTVVFEMQQSTGIRPVESKPFRICPNPLSAGEQLTVYLPETAVGSFTASVYSIQGKKVYSMNGKCKAGMENFTLPTCLTKGIYFLHLQSDNQFYFKKLIIN